MPEKITQKDIILNLKTILSRIENACKSCNRDPNSVRLLMATKTVDPENIITAFDFGQTLIGENRIQEVKSKYEALKGFQHEKHFIGHLQTNKIKDILRYGVTCVESVDRIDLAEKLHQRLTFENKKLDVFIQINTSYEESKFGADPKDAIELVKQVSKLETLNIKGLMTIGLFSAETEKVRKCFKMLKDFQNKINELNLPNVNVKELSMGMSGDLETAIEEGSTIVRVGTAIFGERIYSDSYYWNEKK